MLYFTYFALLYFILDFENKDPISKSTRIPTTEISLFHLLPERRIIWIFTLLQSVNLLLSNSVSAKTYENVNSRRSELSQDTRNINWSTYVYKRILKSSSKSTRLLSKDKKMSDGRLLQTFGGHKYQSTIQTINQFVQSNVIWWYSTHELAACFSLDH